jgi:hypothetical protein
VQRHTRVKKCRPSDCPYPRIGLFKNSLIYSLPKLWNVLDETKFQQNETTFKIAIKNKLFDEENFLQE